MQNGFRTGMVMHVEWKQNVFCHAFPVRFLLIGTVLQLLKHLSLPLRISFDLPGGGYGYFLELYNILSPPLEVIISTSTKIFNLGIILLGPNLCYKSLFCCQY